MACASHDLIGPFNRAATLLDLLVRRHKDQLGAEADRILEFLLASSDRMKDIAAGLNSYIDVASRPPEPAAIGLTECLNAALGRLAKSIADSGATVEAESLPDVFADRSQAELLFELLIGNSIRFARPGVAPQIRISSVHSGNAVDIAVTDNGIGMDPAYANAAFRPFRRLNGAEYPGVGLGLTIAKLITDLHGGSIRIEQPQESGASIHFTLPAANRV